MNTYGHRLPQYPYAKDDVPHYSPNTYSHHPVSHPVATIATPGVNPPFHPNYKYGSRNLHDSVKFSSYDKDVNNHLDYGRNGWSNGNTSDAPPEKFYSMNFPPASSHTPYQSDLKLDNYVPQNYKPETHVQNNWDAPVNQYSSLRLAIFVENCNLLYDLIESDLRELFSYYSGVHSLSISPDYPAAELILTDPNACKVACTDLNGIVLEGIGTLRCVLLTPGQTLSGLLSSANVNVHHGFNVKSYSSTANESTVDTSSSRYSYTSNEHAPLKNFNGMSKTNYQRIGAAKNHVRPLVVNDVEHVLGITNRPNTNRMCRFELVDLFSFEPDFDVTSQILGVNNANIEYIMNNSNNKVDISIKGKPLNSASSTDRLHLTISSNDFYSYNKAIYMVEDLLSSVCEKFVKYVRELGKIVSNMVGFTRHEYEEDSTGTLEYKGSVDKPKTWLDTPKQFVQKPYRNFSKKVSDRSRNIPGSSRYPSSRMPNPRNRGFRN